MLEVTFVPTASVTMQRTCIPFQVELAVEKKDEAVRPFHAVHEVAPLFL